MFFFLIFYICCPTSNINANICARSTNASIAGNSSGLSSRVYNEGISMIGQLPSTAKTNQPPRITTPAARKMHSKPATPQKYILQTSPNHTATCAVTYRPHENASNRILNTPMAGKLFLLSLSLFFVFFFFGLCFWFLVSLSKLYCDFNRETLLQLKK